MLGAEADLGPGASRGRPERLAEKRPVPPAEPADDAAPAASPGSPATEHALPAVAAQTRPPQIHALLLNGGGSANSNYLSHFHHLQDMVAALKSRGLSSDHIDVFSADGEDPGKDLAERGEEPAEFWLLESTSAGRSLNTSNLTNTVWEGVSLRPARLRDLRRWFAGTGQTLRAGDTLLVFVTDHGKTNPDDPDNGFISLWNESLSVLEFRALLEHLQPGVRVVNVMSQCYSGAFAEAMTSFHGRVPSGDVCGFYSTTKDRPAYGCYPEGRDRDRIGHAFRFIDAMGRHESLDDAHSAALLSDDSPDVPVRTSDLFLEKVLQDEAGRQKIGTDEVIEAQLALAWRDRQRWEPQIRLLDRIGEVYGTFSPRAISELKPKIEALQSLSRELDTYEERWKLALDDLRKDNLDRFLEENADWKERLDARKIDGLDPAAKRTTLLALLEALKKFTQARAQVWERLQDLRVTAADAKTAQYRIDVRLAALMRMRALLIRVAGMELLAQDRPAAGHEDEQALLQPESLPPPSAMPTQSALKRALAALEQCEAAPIGAFDASREVPPALEKPVPLAPYEEDLAAARRALPSWLGIRFRPFPDKQRERLEIERGASMVDVVFPDGPASAAGIKTGDVLLGPPEQHFSEPNQIREWTMTSPRDTPLKLDILRDGKPFQMSVSLGPYPLQFPELPPPPKAGDEAPPLGSLKMVRPAVQAAADLKALEPQPEAGAPAGSRSGPAAAPPADGGAVAEGGGEAEAAPKAPPAGVRTLPGEEAAGGVREGEAPQPQPAHGAESPFEGLSGRRHMLFFWATWCVPCKSSVPELLAWSRSSGVPVLAVSDEEAPTIEKFLQGWNAPFLELVASDELRKSYMNYAVSGTPTFVLVTEHGTIEWRQVGYSAQDHLSIPGWSWSGAPH